MSGWKHYAQRGAKMAQDEWRHMASKTNYLANRRHLRANLTRTFANMDLLAEQARLKKMAEKQWASFSTILARYIKPHNRRQIADAASATSDAAKKLHSAVQYRLFEAPMPTAYRLQGRRRPHRLSGDTQQFAKYATTVLLIGFGLFVIVTPMMMRNNYKNAQERYEKYKIEGN
eukprot:GEMP01083974.1.p1 GENE.GEMP01083974.1~~GEMP01083974.1.p1  ORF type:complete len:174 (+),score=45.69 GEMP01083974.1:93-614(+)